MSDLFKAFLKATRTARKRSSFAALVPHANVLSPLPKAKRKPAKAPAKSVKSRRKKTSSARPPRPKPGTVYSGEFDCEHGVLGYKLYTPNGSSRRRMPLIVMLHGCSQTASDFAAGTDMNRIADEKGFLVLYPEQSRTANLARCWNWHDPQHQGRGRGEPAAIAALTRHAIMLGRANPARVYIAGISAGGAAAAIIGAAYPDLFAAVGVHSGVALGNIRTLGAALSAMQGKRAGSTDKLPRQLPTIVFHGDSDRVVHPSNAGGFLSNLERSRPGPLLSRSYRGQSRHGRHFTRKVYRSAAGDVLLEDWTVHGSGHCWAGGRAAGSHTDPAGPDASREMIRFFLSRRRSA